MRAEMFLGGVVLALLSLPAAAQEPAAAKQEPHTFTMPAHPSIAPKNQALDAKNEVSYKNDVLPIFKDYCLNCHIPGGKGYEKSGLDLRTYQSLMKGTKFGPVVKPGDSLTSTLVILIEGRANPALSMPMGIKGSLMPDKVKLIKRWVEQGAKNN
jgi:hypothetical protein